MFTLISLEVVDHSLCATSNQVTISFVCFLSQELAKMKAEAQTAEVGEDGINSEVLIAEETKKKETKFLKHGLEGDEFEDEDIAENTEDANEGGSAKEQ
jgi:hypothetical protein